MRRGEAGRALICGSLAFDTIMVFGDRFANHILPDKIHILNVSFLVQQLRREYGGCAGNIAYNLSLLGDVGYPMATVGRDFAPYKEWMARTGVPADHVRVIEEELTAQAFITTDLDDNQITAFHPGAMQHAHQNRVSDARDIALGIVAPDGREGMIQHAAQFAAAGIPFIFEWQLLQQKTRWGVREVTERVKALIVTRGAAGSVIHTREGELAIPCAPARQVVDPTGCGDAYRAGLIHGLLHGLNWPSTGRIASLMGAVKVESRGTQNHRFTRAEFDARLAAAFPER
jgi:adenosine kinase